MNIKSVEEYFPGMDIIDSNIKEKVDAIYEEVKNSKVTNADIESSLEKDKILKMQE